MQRYWNHFAWLHTQPLEGFGLQWCRLGDGCEGVGWLTGQGGFIAGKVAELASVRRLTFPLSRRDFRNRIAGRLLRFGMDSTWRDIGTNSAWSHQFANYIQYVRDNVHRSCHLAWSQIRRHFQHTWCQDMSQIN